MQLKQSAKAHYYIVCGNSAERCIASVDIPDVELSRLYDRFGITAMYPACACLFDGWPGSENWRVFHGVIPKEWIVKAERIED